MKTIEILSNGRDVQFTTKSVTIAGREYLYSHISELRHSEAKRVYGFKCDDEVVMLPYEEKDARTLKVIFSQVQQMHRKPAAPKPQAAPQDEPEVRAESGSEEVPSETIPEEPIASSEAAPEQPEPEISTEESTTDTAAEDSSQESSAGEETVSPAPSPKERKAAEKAQRKADKEAAKREKQAKKAGGAVPYEGSSDPTDPVQKTARFRKAIIIFVIILAVFALLAIAWYFLIGPASDPQIGPNTTDQTQYNDIDDMINDLEN